MQTRDRTSRSKNGLVHSEQGQGIIPCCYVPRERRRLPRTKSNISSFVERPGREGKEKRRRVDWKKRRGIYWKETRCKCIRFTVKSTGESVQKVSLHQRQVITYTHETPEFKVEVNYLAKDLRLARHLPWTTLAAPCILLRVSLIDDARIREFFSPRGNYRSVRSSAPTKIRCQVR